MSFVEHSKMHVEPSGCSQHDASVRSEAQGRFEHSFGGLRLPGSELQLGKIKQRKQVFRRHEKFAPESCDAALKNESTFGCRFVFRSRIFDHTAKQLLLYL